MLAPVLCESIQEVFCFEHRWEVIDLDHVAKLIRVDTHILIYGEVIVNVLDGNGHCLFQMCLDLTGQTQNNWLQFLALIWPQRERGKCNIEAMENALMIRDGNYNICISVRRIS